MGQIVSDVTSVLDYKKDKKQAATARQQILTQMASDQREKTNLVKKAVAAQRARYGAAGMSNRGMTEGAVLKRIQAETEQPYADKKKANLEKMRAVRTTKPNLVKTLLSRFDELVG